MDWGSYLRMKLDDPLPCTGNQLFREDFHWLLLLIWDDLIWDDVMMQ